MNRVWIVALVALGAAGGTIPAEAAIGYGDGGAAIASALPGGTGSLLVSPQILQIGQAGSDSAPGFGGLGEWAIWTPAQEIDGLGLTRPPLTLLEGPVAFHAPEVALQAPEATETQDRWLFSFSPYVWFPTTSATLTSGPLSTSFSVGPFQYGIPFGAMGHFTALKGKWGFFGDLVYANSFYGGLGPRSDTSVLSTAWIGEAGVTYRLTGQTRNLADWGSVKEPPAVDAYIGGRLFSITQNITVAFRNLGTSVSASSSGTFTSPIIGIRAQFDLSEKWSLLLDANIGGFGVDNTSFAWEAFAVFAYKTRIFSVPATLDIGARAIYMNVQSGPNFQVNETLYGPLVGLTLFW